MDKIFEKPFAINGARVAIPENGTENERVSFDKGFTQPYEIEAPSVDNPAGQGFNILRPEINEALYQLSSACNLLAENIDKWTNLTTENLNDIIQAGRYNQKLSNNATTSRNYPIETAGFLLVFLTGNTALTQIYKPFTSDNFFIRRDSVGNGANWSSWDRLILKSEFDNKITQLQNTDINLNNNKEDKTKINFETMPTNTNWNEVTEQGLYYKPYAVQTGVPSYDRAWVSVFTDETSGGCVQMFNCVGATGAIYKRQKRDGGAWSDWDSITLKSFTEATYRKIADSYTKAQVNDLIVTGGYSRNNYTPANISNATIPIPNKSVISGCTILVTCKYNATTNGTINTTFTFKIDGTSIATATIEKVGNTGAGIGTFYAMRQVFLGLSGRLGKTIIPSLTDTGGIKLIDFSFLVVWQ